MKKVLFVLLFIPYLGFCQVDGRKLVGTIESFSNQTIRVSNKESKASKLTINKQIEIVSTLPKIIKSEQQMDMLSIYETEIGGKVGDPMLYKKLINIDLPHNAVVDEINIINGQQYNVITNFCLAPMQSVYQWDSTNNQPSKLIYSEVYKTSTFYPGKIVSCNVGKDNKTQLLTIVAYPVQFNPSTNKIKIIKRFDVEVTYHVDSSKDKSIKTNPINSQNIIISPTSFLTQANTLKDFYLQRENTSSEIVRLSWIDSNYTVAELPTAIGFANMTTPNIKSTYNYTLARKITAFLRDQANLPNLESITLLGDATIIPPSYYFYIAQGLDDYNRWIPSDMYYASPDYDHVMNYSVGRIPMNTTTEINNYLTKMNNWKTNLSSVWFNNVQVCGGNPFASKYYTGELITLKAINDGYFQGMNVGKNFYTNRKDYTVTIKPYFNNGNVGILYHIGHGLGNTMYFSSGNAISTYTISSLAAATKYPVVFSIACMNGGFDAELVTNADFPDCMGEGLMRAPAGSISYYGSARKATGGPIIGFDESGEVAISSLTYMARMLNTCLKTYSEGTLRMGEIAKNGLSQFLASADISDPYDMLTAYEFVYLGDPVLSMLPIPGTNNYQQPKYSLDPEPFEINEESEPVYYYTNANHLPIKFSNLTNSPAVNYNLYEVKSDFATADLGSITDAAAPFLYTHTPSAAKLMLLCASANDGKESRIYFNTKLVNNLPPISCYLDTINNISQGNYNLNWTPSTDYDGVIASYTLKEMIHPISILDECTTAEKWLLNKFTINGTGSAASFYSGTGDSYLATLRSFYPVYVQAGDSLKFTAKYDIENGFDFAFVEVSTDGVNYTALGEYTGVISTFTSFKYSLADYEGQKIYIQFRYKTDGGTNGSGIYVDNIYPAGWFQTINLIENIADTSFLFSSKPEELYNYSVKAKDNVGVESAWSNLREINVSQNATEVVDLINNVAVYPNPASETINFYLQNKVNLTIELYDNLGKLCQVIDYPQSTQIQVSNYKQGVYYLKIYSNSTFVGAKKVVIQH